MNKTAFFLVTAVFLLFFAIEAQEQCGHSFGMVTGKIVGGYDVGYYKYPWFVSLYKYNIPYCGATLISKKTVVTAAHCYQQYVNNPKGSENEYELKMGTYNICDSHEPTLKTYEAKKVYIHEKYAAEDPFFDIALIILKEEVPFEPACLPSKHYDSKERPKEGLIAGYGVIKYNGHQTSCIMREARIRIYSDDKCKKMLKKVDPELNNFAAAFCAGYLKGGIDACQGDSGGPLMVLESGSRFVLLGLTSFGYKCADKGLLGVYTDVSEFLDWIHTKSNASTTDDPYDTDDDGDSSSDHDEDEDSDSSDTDDDDDNSESDNNDEDDDSDERKRRKKNRFSGENGNDTKKNRCKNFKGRKIHHLKKKKTNSSRTKTVFEIMKVNKSRPKKHCKHPKKNRSKNKAHTY